MTELHRFTQQRNERVDIFGTENRADWPADSAAAADFAALKPILPLFPAASVGQLRDPISDVTITLSDKLWNLFKAIAKTSRAIAEREAGFNAGPFALPPDRSEHVIKRHADALLTLLEDVTSGPEPDPAETLAAKAALREKFIHRLMPASFVATLRRDRDAIDGKNLHKTVDNQTGVASTAALDQACRESDVLCRSLDAALCNLYSENPEKLAAWKSAVRLERPGKNGRKAEMPEEPPASAAAAAPTV